MFKKILVAIDTSDYSRLVVPAAVEIAGKFQSEVFVLHVNEHDRGRVAAYTTESAADATGVLVRGVKEFRDAGISAKGEVRDVAVGHVAKCIADTAMELQSDLIVMGSRGLSDVEGILLGSVTHKVMHLTRTAVLITRGPVPVRQPEAEPVHALALAAQGI